MKSSDGFIKRGFSVVLFVLFLSSYGCGGGRTMVMNRPDNSVKAKSVSISIDNATVDVPEYVTKYFDKYLAALLYEGDPNSDVKIVSFHKGPELKLIYKFIQYEPGERVARYFGAGMGSGEGSLTVEATYYDNNNNKICTIQAFGNVTAGFFGGSFDIAIENTAHEVANFTIKNFKGF